MRAYDAPGEDPDDRGDTAGPGGGPCDRGWDDTCEEQPYELIRPEDFLGPSGIPADARRMGLDRNTEEGALIALAGRLDPAKLSHRVVAWVLLVAFAAPLVLGLVHPMY